MVAIHWIVATASLEQSDWNEFAMPPGPLKMEKQGYYSIGTASKSGVESCKEFGGSNPQTPYKTNSYHRHLCNVSHWLTFVETAS